MSKIILRGLLTIFPGFISLFSWGQNEIQYQNKALQKVLQNSGITDFTKIHEIPVADSINQNYTLQGKFFEIRPEISQNKYIYVGRLNSCRAGGCSISVAIPKNGESEYFDYFILYDRDKTVKLVKVFNYQATHGQEITAKGWLKQFIGYNDSKSLQVNKNVDAISGATISVYAITFDIEMKTKILKSL